VEVAPRLGSTARVSAGQTGRPAGLLSTAGSGSRPAGVVGGEGMDFPGAPVAEKGYMSNCVPSFGGSDHDASR